MLLNSLLDRGYGKAPQSLDIGYKDVPRITMIHDGMTPQEAADAYAATLKAVDGFVLVAEEGENAPTPR